MSFILSVTSCFSMDMTFSTLFCAITSVSESDGEMERVFSHLGIADEEVKDICVAIRFIYQHKNRIKHYAHLGNAIMNTPTAELSGKAEEIVKKIVNNDWTIKNPDLIVKDFFIPATAKNTKPDPTVKVKSNTEESINNLSTNSKKMYVFMSVLAAGCVFCGYTMYKNHKKRQEKLIESNECLVDGIENVVDKDDKLLKKEL